MPPGPVVALGLGWALGVLLAAAPPAVGPAPMPQDFTLPKAESSPGDVSFSHQKHRAKVEKCTTCHMRDLRMHRGQSGPITLEAKLQGKYCGACHDGKTRMGDVTVFPIDECDRCHRP